MKNILPINLIYLKNPWKIHVIKVDILLYLIIYYYYALKCI